MDTTVLRRLIERVDLDGINNILHRDPDLANEVLPLNDRNPARAHPLHRICDGVFAGKYSDRDAVEIARIFLSHGARVNGNEVREKADTPLIAAASLRADEVAILYIERGADINHPGTHGGSALHWSSWCGRDRVVARLLEARAEINLRCIDFKATPLAWAIHGYKLGGPDNQYRQVECVRGLLEAGADRNIPNGENLCPVDMLDARDTELRHMLTGAVA